MQPQNSPATELEKYFATLGQAHAHAYALADLVLDRLPNSEHAYLRPEDDEPRYWITDAGRRALREAGQ